MNAIDRFLARLPITSLSLHVHMDSYAVIERVEIADHMKIWWRKRKRYFTFQADDEGNYFTIQAQYHETDGHDVFPPKRMVTILGVSFPVPVEESPILFGRVFDNKDGDGATIKCHFGIPIPIYLAGISAILFLAGRIFPSAADFASTAATLTFIWSLISFNQFIVERKGLIEVMEKLFHDVLA
jgi:hypothetical protein